MPWYVVDRKALFNTYLIKKLIEQPIMSVGHLIIKAGEEKPPQLVDNHAVVCCR